MAEDHKDLVSSAFLSEVVQEAAAQALLLLPKAKKLSKQGANEFSSALSTADIELQKLIISHLRNRFPNTPIVGEEDTLFALQEPNPDQNNYFIVDPIDGSYFFLKHSPHYAVQVAFVSNDHYVACAAALPAYGIRISAPPWTSSTFGERSGGRTAFCSPDTDSTTLDAIRAAGYSPVFACGLQCIIAPLLWPDSIGVYPGELSIRGKIGLALALEGGALIFRKGGRPVNNVSVSGHVESILAISKSNDTFLEHPTLFSY